jgi:hypothetical protein
MILLADDPAMGLAMVWVVILPIILLSFFL